MNLAIKQYNTQILESIESYLKMFPSEISSLNRLKAQLEDKNTDLLRRDNFIGHLTGSSLFYNQKNNKVLLVHHRSLDIWIQPGGHIDPDELPLTAALREFKEETKIEFVDIHPWHKKFNVPLDIDTHFIPANPKKNEPEHYHHDFLYLVIEDKINPASQNLDVDLSASELKAYKWIDLFELQSGEFEPKLKRAASKVRNIILK